ncbi:hypothetical protein HK097_004380, partial [Rhizophlyctis rosea]
MWNRSATESVDGSRSAAPITFSETDFQQVDAHAAHTPFEVTYNIASLSDYLTSPFTSDSHKLRAIYFWVTHNISYDVQLHQSGVYGGQSAGSALRDRRAVCAGYADLFTDLARKAGLDVRTVYGGARGGPTRPGDTFFEPSSHAWNVVRIRSQYLFVDSTWGAGHISGPTFTWQFEPHWFLVRPKHMIYSHFPMSPQDQYLSPPLDEQHFLDVPHVKPRAVDDHHVLDCVG